jgi:hypothetical protein
MHIATILNLVGTFAAVAVFAWRKQWLMSLAWLFSLAYIVFDKVFRFALPENLVTSFSFVFLALVLISCWRNYSHKRVI